MATPDEGRLQFDPTAPYYSSAPKTNEQPTQPQFDPNSEYSAAPPTGPTTAWQKFKDRLFEPVKQEEIEKIPGLQPEEVETLKEQGLAAGQPTLRAIFGKEQGDAIRQHLAFGLEPEVFARGALKTLTDWYSPAQLAMSVPGRIAHGYAAAAEAAQHAGLLERANQLAGKARLAGAIGTVSGVPFVAKQVQGLIDNWDGMSPTERAAALAGILGGGVLSGVGAHEVLSAKKVMGRIAAEQNKAIEPVNPEYPTRVYNGTAADVGSIEDLDAKYSLPRATAGPGVYLTRDPQVASEYVKNTQGAKVLGGSLHNKATLLDAQKELPEMILKEEGLPPNTTYLSQLERLREEAGGLEESIPEIKNFQRTLADHGFHGVDNVYGNRDVISIFGNDILPPGQRYNDLVKSGIPAKGGNFVAESAQRYNVTHGNPEIDHIAPPVDAERAHRLAEEMDKHVHEPENPKVQEAYGSLIRDVKAQWDHAVNDLHIKFEPSAEDPYDSYNAVKDDVLKNRRMKIFTGGNPLPPDHPLAAVDPDTGLTYNTMLRGVHDLFGHVAGDNDFSEQGEGGATYAHKQMMSPKSVPALLNETEGQVSQYFHGKGKGNFPEQKATIVPNEFLESKVSPVVNKADGEEIPLIEKLKEKFGSTRSAKKLLEPGASFVYPDGTATYLGSVDHPIAIAGLESGRDAFDVNKAAFIDRTGTIRIRFSHDHSGDTLHISVPRDGVTEEQVDMLKQVVAQNRYGNFVIERSDATYENIGRRGKVVEYAKPADVEKALKYIGAHPDQHLRRTWLKNTLKEMDEHTAGAFDPNTGKEDTTGVGVEIYPEARASRKPLDHKPTEEDLVDFYTEHKDLFEKHPELRLGWDKTDKGWELNIGASGVREGAIKVGKKLDQRAVWDIENKEEIPTGGKGLGTEFRNYPLADRLRDLTGSQVIKPEMQKEIVERPKAPRGSSIDLLENPIPKTEKELTLFADKVHRGMTLDGTALTDFQKVLGRWVRETAGHITKPSAILKRAIGIAENEINHWMMETGGQGLGWYKKTAAGAIDALKEVHPNLEDPDHATIFKALWTAHSYGQKPFENLEQAERNLTNLEKTGKVAYDQSINDPQTGQPRKWAGHSGNVFTLAKTQHLIDTMGENGAAKWLTEKHTWPEIEAEFDKAGLNVSKKGIPFFDDGTTYGSMAFGPKGGAFFLNLNGIHDFTTVDIWGARALRRWEGRSGQADTLSTEPRTGVVVDNPPSVGEIDRFHKVIEAIGKKMGFDNGDVQALQWYYEHKLYEVHGVGEEARDYEKAAKEVAARRERGEAGGAKKGTIGALDFIRALSGEKPGVRSGEDAGAGEEAPGGRKVPNTGELFAGNEGSAGREPEEEGKVKPEQQKEHLKRLPENERFPGDVIADIDHELGHVVVGDALGIPSREGVRSDRHPNTQGVASMRWDLSSLGADESGSLPFSKAKPHLDKLIIGFMGGGAAEEMLHGIPMNENEGMQGDLNTAHQLLQFLGYTTDEAWDKIETAKDRAKEILTKPGITDTIKKYSATREEDLPETHHMSEARVNQLLEEIHEQNRRENQERRAGAGNTGGNRGVVTGINQKMDAGAKSGGESGAGQKASQLGISPGAAFLAGGGPKKQAPPAPVKRNLPAGAAALAGKQPKDIPSTIDDAADEFGIPRDLFQTQARQESRLDPHAVSPKGAQGVMQLMPRVSKDLGVKDPFDPQENIRAGAKLMRDLHHRFGYWDRALAAYDWQPDRVQDAIDLYGPAWLEHTPKETQDYVRKILKRKS